MKVIFLDRDGVIDEYPGDYRYVTKWDEFKFIPGSIKAIKKFNEAGFKVFVISNQAGVAKGVYSQEELDSITEKMLEMIKEAGAYIDSVYYCTHRVEDNCSCRKPKTGLLKQAVAQYEKQFDPDESFFIGDTFMDMNAAKAFGVKPVLVLSGKEKLIHQERWAFKPDYVFDNLFLAAQYICAHYG